MSKPRQNTIFNKLGFEKGMGWDDKIEGKTKYLRLLTINQIKPVID
jgi:hypothetical protein